MFCFSTRGYKWKWKVKVKSLNSVRTPCDPMDWSLSGSSVHGIFQVKVLEWVAISFSTIRVTQIGRKQLQKTDFTPSAPLKIEEQDKRQRKGFSPPQHINNSWEIKIQPGNKIQGNKIYPSPPLCASRSFTFSQGAMCRGPTPGTSDRIPSAKHLQ